MNVDQVLRDLDKHASEFNFPILDNAYVSFAGARVTAFAGVDHWAIVFEVLGFSEREAEFTLDLYGFGSCIFPGGVIGQDSTVSESRSSPLFDPQSKEFIATPANWMAIVNGQETHFKPSALDYENAGLHFGAIDGWQWREVDLLRFVLYRFDEKLYLNDSQLRSYISKCHQVEKFLQTTSWHHPDVSRGELPSANIALRSLVEALAAKEPRIFRPGIPNTYWHFWDRG